MALVMRALRTCGYLSSLFGYVILNNFTKSFPLSTISNIGTNAIHYKVENKKQKTQVKENRKDKQDKNKEGWKQKVKSYNEQKTHKVIINKRGVHGSL